MLNHQMVGKPDCEDIWFQDCRYRSAVVHQKEAWKAITGKLREVFTKVSTLDCLVQLRCQAPTEECVGRWCRDTACMFLLFWLCVSRVVSAVRCGWWLRKDGGGGHFFMVWVCPHALSNDFMHRGVSQMCCLLLFTRQRFVPDCIVW